MRATKSGLLYWSAMVVLCLGLSLGLSGSLWAAPTFVNANDPDLPGKANGVPMGGALNVFDLELEGEGTVTLKLERFEIFAPDAELTVVGDSGLPR